MTDAAASDFDVAVVGAGPAGLSAAATAADTGLRVALIDDQHGPGGQIFRALARSDARRLDVLGDDYAAGGALLDGISHPGVSHLAGAAVWDVTRSRQMCLSQGGRSRMVSARQVILATGASERPMPFPGWTLPGVMTAGAGQILLKASGLLPSGPTVLVGSGPLLFLLAAQYLRAGVSIAALVETTPRANLRSAMVHLPGALRGNAYLRKGIALLRAIRANDVPRFKSATGLRARGDSGVECLEFTAGGRSHVVPCTTLLIHNGVVPNVQLTCVLGAQHVWDAGGRCWRPRLDDWGQSDVAGIAVAGDGGGIAGAGAAVHAGRLCALHAAHRLGALSRAERDARAVPERCALEYHRAVRPFLDALYAPSAEFLVPGDETLVCRCEEITAGDIRRYVGLGCLDPNQAKSFGRPGMGPCQGRLCGLTVSEVIAAARGVAVQDVGHLRIRPPIKPVGLHELASMELPPPEAEDADALA